MELNLAAAHEAISEAIPERECIVFRERRLSYRDVGERSRRLANRLVERGFGVRPGHDPRSSPPWESGHDHLALYLYNGNEYIEGMLGAFKARVAPVNINYRYVEDELVHVLADSRARGIVYHAAFAPRLHKILGRLPELELLVQVTDESDHDLLPGAVEYESWLAGSSARRPELDWSPDDPYVLYTGGTTGLPKGVLWRQADIWISGMGGRRPQDGGVIESIEELVAGARQSSLRVMPLPPFMHAGGQWFAFGMMNGGSTLVIQSVVERLDARDVLSSLAREHVNLTILVGDAFARPLLDEMDRTPYDLRALGGIYTGGAALSAPLKQAFLERLPGAVIIDAVGASETGSQGQHVSSAGSEVQTGRFTLTPGNVVLSEDLEHVLEPGHEGTGWWAKSGAVPLGYLGDEAKTRQTFPVVNGIRYAVPGDRVRWLADGSIELLGRDSVTINSGGEKIFAEEVEAALQRHPAVWDVVVTGRPSERWGHEVVAIVRLRDGAQASADELREAAALHVARYKLPKAILFRDEIVRSPSGKPDYRWARAQASHP